MDVHVIVTHGRRRRAACTGGGGTIYKCTCTVHARMPESNWEAGKVGNFWRLSRREGWDDSSSVVEQIV